MKTKKEESVVGDVMQLQSQSLAAAAVQHNLRVDPMTAKRSLNAGVDYVGARKQQFAKLFPEVQFDELVALPALCDRYLEVSGSVASARASRRRSASRPLVAKGLIWRRKLMSLAAALVSNGKLSADTLDELRAGVGTVDAMNDVAKLTVLLAPYRDFIELACGEGALAEAKAAAETAFAALGAEPKPDTQAIDQRDRYATLISRGHDLLRVIVARLSGSYKEAEQIVGPLSKHAPRKAKPTPEVPPVAPS